MESWFAGHEVPAASKTRELPDGIALSAHMSTAIDAAMENSNAVGVMTYSLQEDGSVRQFGEASTDQGLSWQTGFDLIYRPKAPTE